MTLGSLYVVKKKELYLQERDNLMIPNKDIIWSILMLVPLNTTLVYQWCVIYFIVFSFGEGVTIIDWTENMNIYMFLKLWIHTRTPSPVIWIIVVPHTCCLTYYSAGAHAPLIINNNKHPLWFSTESHKCINNIIVLWLFQ